MCGATIDSGKEILDLEDKMKAIYAVNDLPNYFKYYADDFTQWLPEGRTDLPQYKKEWTAFIQGVDGLNQIRFPTGTCRSIWVEILWSRATSRMSRRGL